MNEDESLCVFRTKAAGPLPTAIPVPSFLAKAGRSGGGQQELKLQSETLARQGDWVGMLATKGHRRATSPPSSLPEAVQAIRQNEDLLTASPGLLPPCRLWYKGHRKTEPRLPSEPTVDEKY